MITYHGLVPEQAAALAQIERAVADGRGGFNVGGFAGAGKTELLKHTARAHPEAYLCALSNRTAALLREKTGRGATTIHRLIKQFRGFDEDGQPTFRQKGFWAPLVLLDESSVVDTTLAADLAASAGTIIAFGDPAQLLPFGGRAQGFPTPDVTLQKIHRQALDSGIVRQAHRVRESGQFETDGEFQAVALAPDRDFFAADMILCCEHKTRVAINHYCRRLRGYQGAILRKGEPLLCSKNDYKREIYNGERWTVDEDCRLGRDRLVISDGRDTKRLSSVAVEDLWTGAKDAVQFRLGYAGTVTAAQGAEWASVVLVNERSFDTRWLYTAITRASNQLIVTKGRK